MVMVVMVMPRGKYRSSKHQQEQGREKNLLHMTNVAWKPFSRYVLGNSESKLETGLKMGARRVDRDPFVEM